MVFEHLLSTADRNLLLTLARQSILQGVAGKEFPALNRAGLSPILLQPGASFVTLTQNGQLRGCIGALEAYQPLVDDVCEHALAAAVNDYRFAPVHPGEIESLQIEISRLTKPQILEYTQPEDLPNRLTPQVDGVILQDGFRRATFLPQVWEKLPGPAEFLAQLCQKMGAPSNLWRKKILEVWTYRVEEFHEER
jgi:AmmeMemoRadiSam system protein A